MKPAILIVEQSSELGGAQLGLLDLIPALLAEFSPCVAIPSPGPLAERLERIGVPWLAWPLGDYSSLHKPVGEVLRFAARFPASASRLIRAARQSGARLLLANGPRAFPAVAVAARRCGIPSLWQLAVEVISARGRCLCRVAARLSRPVVVANSRACLAPFPPESTLFRRARVIYPGITLKQVEAAPASPGVVGVIGLLHPDKGHDVLLRAAPLLPGMRMRFYGAGPCRQQFQELADRLAPGRVEFCGWVDDAAQALAGLEVLVVPSRREALARVILEAFAARVPVVAAAAGGIPEVIQPEKNGLLFPPGDSPALAAAITRLRNDRDLRDRLVEQAYQDYRSRWRLERFQEEMLQTLREVLHTEC